MDETDRDRVLVVVPLYNGANYIDETLRSVEAQSYTDVEVVVVDDGSTDDGLRRCSIGRERTPESRCTKASSGIADTRNHALAASTPGSAYVLFLDQDDVLPPDFFSRAVSLLRCRPDAVGAAALVDLVGPDGRPFDDGSFASAMLDGYEAPSALVGAHEPMEVHFEQMFIRNRLCPPSCVVLRSSVVASVGGPDASYAVADDWDLMLKVLRHGPVLFLSGARVGYRRHGSNASDSAGGQNIHDSGCRGPLRGAASLSALV